MISADAYTVDGVRRLEEQGVTDVIIGFRWPYTVGPDAEPLGQKIDSLRRFADEVITKVAGPLVAPTRTCYSFSKVAGHRHPSSSCPAQYAPGGGVP